MMRTIQRSTAGLCLLILSACQSCIVDPRSTTPIEASPETESQIVKRVERDIEMALVSGDRETLETHLASDLLYHHGDAWLEGDAFLFDDTKASLLDVADAGNYVMREVLESDAQLHDNVAITRGLSAGKLKREGELLSFRVRYLRVYEKRQGQWQMLTHFTTKLYLDGRAPLSTDR